jgi:hypothetical protein
VSTNFTTSARVVNLFLTGLPSSKKMSFLVLDSFYQ